MRETAQRLSVNRQVLAKYGGNVSENFTCGTASATCQCGGTEFCTGGVCNSCSDGSCDCTCLCCPLPPSRA
jgi:hypothetical protein